MPTITPLEFSFGAVVTDISLAHMSKDEWHAVEDAFHKYAALVFPGQHLTEDEQIAFGERFGERFGMCILTELTLFLLSKSTLCIFTQ